MNTVYGKNGFRKIFTSPQEVKPENIASFRKGVTERLSTPLKENNTLERIPGHDSLYFE